MSISTQTAPVVRQSLKVCPPVPASSGLTVSETGAPKSDNKAFQVAIKEKRIEQAPIGELKSALQYAMFKVGIRAQNLPSREESALLIDHAIRLYGGHTASEIRLAFDLALQEKLNLKEVSCFENFSCLYFSIVMNAYRAWAREEYRQIKIEPPMIENKESLSDQAMSDWLQDLAARVAAGGYLPEFTPIALYDWLDLAGRIPLTPAQKQDYLVRAVDRRLGLLTSDVERFNTEANRSRLREFAEMRRQGEFTGDYVRQLKDLAKRLALYDLLKDPSRIPSQRKSDEESKPVAIKFD